MSNMLLEIIKVKKYFPVNKIFFRSKVESWVKAVDGVSFSIPAGKIVSFVGESGCGKTTTARLILLLEKLTEGRILFKGKDVNKFNRCELNEYKAEVQAVFQDPYSSFNPRMRIREFVCEPLYAQKQYNQKDIKIKFEETLEMVKIDPTVGSRYPHMFSGGQRQRLALARALIVNPSVIVLDEPVSALDVSIRAQILNLLNDLQRQTGASFLLISHDLATVRHMSNIVGVMYLGKIVELGKCENIYEHTLHPYTEALISAALPSHPDQSKKTISLPGEVPSAADLPTGCRFHPRCFYSKPLCAREEPELFNIKENHWVACHFLERGK